MQHDSEGMGGIKASDVQAGESRCVLDQVKTVLQRQDRGPDLLGDIVLELHLLLETARRNSSYEGSNTRHADGRAWDSTTGEAGSGRGDLLLVEVLSPGLLRVQTVGEREHLHSL